MGRAEHTIRVWQVAKRLTRASDDELAVVERIVERMDRGREVYGALDLEADDRDFGSEGWDELVDFVLYSRMDEVQALREAEHWREVAQQRGAVVDNLVAEREASRRE